MSAFGGQAVVTMHSVDRCYCAAERGGFAGLLAAFRLLLRDWRRSEL